MRVRGLDGLDFVLDMTSVAYNFMTADAANTANINRRHSEFYDHRRGMTVTSNSSMMGMGFDDADSNIAPRQQFKKRIRKRASMSPFNLKDKVGKVSVKVNVLTHSPVQLWVHLCIYPGLFYVCSNTCQFVLAS